LGANISTVGFLSEKEKEEKDKTSEKSSSERRGQKGTRKKWGQFAKERKK